MVDSLRQYGNQGMAERRRIFNEFQELSPEAQISYQSVLGGLDPEQVRMGRQMGDIEMQMSVAPRLGYTGPTDRELDMIRYDLGSPNLNLRGEFTPRSVDGMVSAVKASLPVEEYMMHTAPRRATFVDKLSYVTPREDRSQITLYGSAGANPRTIAHEIQHSRGASSETKAYAAEVINSRNEDEYEHGIRQYVAHAFQDFVQDKPFEEQERMALKSIGKNHASRLYLDEFKRTGGTYGAEDDKEGIMAILGVESRKDESADGYAKNRFDNSFFGKKVDELGVYVDPRPSKIDLNPEFYDRQAETMLPKGLDQRGNVIVEDLTNRDEEGLGALIETIVSSTETILPGIDYQQSDQEREAQVREMAATAQMLRKAGAPITSEEDVEKIPMEILDQLNTILDRSPEE